MKKSTVAIAASLTAMYLTAPVAAVAYPIDCAILLCLAGGFPPSAECSAAKATMIRRITPWPIEPPLQLWNCPMGVSADVAGMLATAGLSILKTGPDGLTDDVRAYRDNIEIYHILDYRVIHNDNSDEVHDVTQKGEYTANGDFRWVQSSYALGPTWLSAAVGGWIGQLEVCSGEGHDRECNWTGTQNMAGNIRGVAIRTKAHDGTYQTEWIKY